MATTDQMQSMSYYAKWLSSDFIYTVWKHYKLGIISILYNT